MAPLQVDEVGIRVHRLDPADTRVAIEEQCGNKQTFRLQRTAESLKQRRLVVAERRAIDEDKVLGRAAERNARRSMTTGSSAKRLSGLYLKWGKPSESMVAWTDPSTSRLSDSPRW